MGIPTEIETSADCLLVFPADETPRQSFVKIEGMQQGALWIPADGPPPNSIWKLKNLDLQPCNWFTTVLPWTFTLTVGGGLTTLRADHTAQGFQFHDILGIPPGWEFINNQQNPAGLHFWNGTASAFYGISGGTGTDFGALAGLFNLDDGIGTVGEPFDIDADEEVWRAVNVAHQINVRMKIDIS